MSTIHIPTLLSELEILDRNVASLKAPFHNKSGENVSTITAGALTPTDYVVYDDLSHSLHCVFSNDSLLETDRAAFDAELLAQGFNAADALKYSTALQATRKLYLDPIGAKLLTAPEIVCNSFDKLTYMRDVLETDVQSKIMRMLRKKFLPWATEHHYTDEDPATVGTDNEIAVNTQRLADLHPDNLAETLAEFGEVTKYSAGDYSGLLPFPGQVMIDIDFPDVGRHYFLVTPTKLGLGGYCKATIQIDINGYVSPEVKVSSIPASTDDFRLYATGGLTGTIENVRTFAFVPYVPTSRPFGLNLPEYTMAGDTGQYVDYVAVLEASLPIGLEMLEAINAFLMDKDGIAPPATPSCTWAYLLELMSAVQGVANHAGLADVDNSVLLANVFMSDLRGLIELGSVVTTGGGLNPVPIKALVSNSGAVTGTTGTNYVFHTGRRGSLGVANLSSDALLGSLIVDGEQMALVHEALVAEPTSSVTALTVEERASLSDNYFLGLLFSPQSEDAFSWVNSHFNGETQGGVILDAASSFVGLDAAEEPVDFNTGKAEWLSKNTINQVGGFSVLLPFPKTYADLDTAVAVTIDLDGSIESSTPTVTAEELIARDTIRPDLVTWTGTVDLVQLLDPGAVYSAEQLEVLIRAHFRAEGLTSDTDDFIMRAMSARAYVSYGMADFGAGFGIFPFLRPFEAKDMVSLIVSSFAITPSSQRALRMLSNFTTRMYLPF